MRLNHLLFAAELLDLFVALSHVLLKRLLVRLRRLLLLLDQLDFDALDGVQDLVERGPLVEVLMPALSHEVVHRFRREVRLLQAVALADVLDHRLVVGVRDVRIRLFGEREELPEQNAERPFGGRDGTLGGRLHRWLGGRLHG